MKYHPAGCDVLTDSGKPRAGPWQVGSLTGAVASERVTEAREGWLSAVGTRALERNGISQPHGEIDGSSRDESRS